MTQTPSTRSRLSQLLWLLAGLLTGLLTLAWVLWLCPHPLLELGPPGRAVADRLNPVVYAAVLVTWACFAQAVRCRNRTRPRADGPGHSSTTPAVSTPSPAAHPEPRGTGSR